MVVSNARRYFPQALACFAKNTIAFNYGLMLCFPTILIPALTGLNSVNNPNEHLSITPGEASWIASIPTINFVIGSLMSSFLDPLGRKKSIILGNISYLIGWLTLYQSNSLWPIYIASMLMGFTSGLLEAPIVCYISEIAEPSTRTLLLATTNFTFEISAVLIYFLANQMPWRDATLIFAAVPIISAMIMLVVPETPQWLLSRNRKDDALRSLQWFRGWVEPNAVQVEFENLQRYKAVAYVCYECEKQGTPCNHPQPKFTERLRELGRRKTIFPLFLIIWLFLTSVFCGAVFRPFLVPILKVLKSPIDPNRVLVWLGYIGLVANTLNLIITRSMGKRITFLLSLALAILTLYTLGAYGFLQSNQYDVGSILNYFPVIGFLLLFFFYAFGLRPVPNYLLCEIFSYRSKSLATGIGLAVSDIIMSVTTKTFHLTQAVITLSGQCVAYATIGVLGFVIIYLTLPETEGRSLEDIEMYFSDKKRKFNDLYIPQRSSQEKIANR